MTQPLISCICISEKRIEFLKKSINYFLNQTYKRKELIILSRIYSPIYEKMIKEFNQNGNIRYLNLNDLTKSATLGDMRNMAISECHGDYWCCWDDDDWFHKMRLEIQIQELLRNNKQGSILTYCIFFDTNTNKAYMSFPIGLPPSILCKKSESSIRYASLDRGEDMPLLSKAYELNILYPIVRPTLYIYVKHKTNTVSNERFEYFISYSKLLSPHLSSILGRMVRNEIGYEEACDLIDSPNHLKELDYYHHKLPRLVGSGK